MSKLTNRRLIFLGISLLYSSSYLLMYFNPFIHDNTPAFLLTGVLLLMIFLLFRDFLDKGLRVKVITGLVSLIVLLQLISELTTLRMVQIK
ncbi:MAG: hypothetical protein RBQ95_03840 [Paracholeplasma sp.]|nr:hypothetical protein [Paracholeplasma sp.]MDY3195969.1 hypothetical protein [Paracholeplasma sp.]